MSFQFKVIFPCCGSAGQYRTPLIKGDSRTIHTADTAAGFLHNQ